MMRETDELRELSANSQHLPAVCARCFVYEDKFVSKEMYPTVMVTVTFTVTVTVTVYIC